MDIENLLDPLDLKAPCGTWLRYDAKIDQIRDVRGHVLRGDKTRDGLLLGWNDVIDACMNVLQHDSKDFQVAGWLTEAFAYNYGWGGLIKGLTILQGLIESYWDQAYPPLDEATERRLGTFLWLDRSLVPAMHQWVVTSPADDGLMPYKWYQIIDRHYYHKKGLFDYIESEDVYKNHLRQTPLSWWKDGQKALVNVDRLLNTLKKDLDERFHGDGPSFHESRQVLKQIIQFMRMAQQTPQIDNSTSESVIIGEPHPPTPSITPWTIEDREAAFRVLGEAADFLARENPHSPTPLLIRRAIQWGQMDLMEILDDCHRQGIDMVHMISLLGLGKKDLSL